MWFVFPYQSKSLQKDYLFTIVYSSNGYTAFFDGFLCDDYISAQWIYVTHRPLSVRVDSLVLGAIVWLSQRMVSDLALMDMGKWTIKHPQKHRRVRNNLRCPLANRIIGIGRNNARHLGLNRSTDYKLGLPEIWLMYVWYIWLMYVWHCTWRMNVYNPKTV